MQGQNRGYGRGRGFRGGRGSYRSGYTNREGYGYNSQGSAGPSGNANGGNVQVNAAYGSYDQGPPECFACHGRNKNGGVEREYPHAYADRCYQLNELYAKGVCHRNANGKLCLGPWDPNAEEVFLRRDSPWIAQILMRTQGTQWDVRTEDRPGNICRQEELRRDAVPSYVGGILKPGAGIPINQVSIIDDCGQGIDDLLEERVQEVHVNAVGARRKPDGWGSAKETFRQRAAAEEKMARPKTKRPSAYVPRESTEPIGMDVDLDIDDEITRPGFPIDRETSEDTL
jgi:hypothetical protein